MKPITYLVGDATRPEGLGVKIIAHCCNDRGAWGAGFVMALSRRWPQPEEQYRLLLRSSASQRLVLGAVQFVKVEDQIAVANIIGQYGIHTPLGIDGEPRPPIRYQALSDGLNMVAHKAYLWNASVHMPRIGCGLAGGVWDRVEALIETTLCARDIGVYVYDLPLGALKPALAPRIDEDPDGVAAAFPEPALA